MFFAVAGARQRLSGEWHGHHICMTSSACKGEATKSVVKTQTEDAVEHKTLEEGVGGGGAVGGWRWLPGCQGGTASRLTCFYFEAFFSDAYAITL